jgi:hypothetical protein
MKLKDLIKSFAGRKGIDEEIVKVIILGTYKELRRQMDEMEQNHLEMPGLGTFSIKHWKMDKALHMWEALYKKYPAPHIEQGLKTLKNAKINVDKEQKERALHKEKRKEWVHKNLYNENQGDITESMGE